MKADLENLDYRKPPKGQKASPKEKRGDASERSLPKPRVKKHTSQQNLNGMFSDFRLHFCFIDVTDNH